MVTYRVTTQTGSRIITTQEEAKKIICSSAKVLMGPTDAVINNYVFQDLARAFDIDLTTIIATPTTDWQDYPYDYSFPDTEEEH